LDGGREKNEGDKSEERDFAEAERKRGGEEGAEEIKRKESRSQATRGNITSQTSTKRRGGH